MRSFMSDYTTGVIHCLIVMTVFIVVGWVLFSFVKHLDDKPKVEICASAGNCIP